MNYFSYYLSRILAFAAIGILMMGVQTAGVWIQQRRDAASYERLGSAVSDGGKFDMHWWLWPPQAHLSGWYRGLRFSYQKGARQTSHLLVECVPAAGGEASMHHPGKLPPGELAALNQRFPGWIALYASRTAVPWTKRSLDRRPLGLGSEPGIDLYRQCSSAFDAPIVQSDLESLQTFCQSGFGIIRTQ